MRVICDTEIFEELFYRVNYDYFRQLVLENLYWKMSIPVSLLELKIMLATICPAGT